MIWRPSLLKRFCMTTDALGRKPLAVELADGSGFVAGIAISYGMRSDQRETVLMFIDVVHGDLPSRDFVADVALRAVAATVNIGVAILTVAADFCENCIC